jgi:putative sterol carrier protein
MAVYRYCTPEWLESSTEAFQSDPRFQQQLARLSTRICFRIKAEPAWGIDQDIIFCSYIQKGELQKLAFINDKEARDGAEFVVAATPQEWKKILRKESKFVTDFMLGKITLEQGSKVGILGVAPHSNTLVDGLTRSELQFPDEMSPEELADFRAYVERFRAELGV